MVFGVALSTVAGMAGAVFYVVHHITVQTSLFLVTGMIERRAGTTSLDRLGGLMKLAPLIAVLFFVPAMNLAGIPPMSGFLGKLALIQAGVADGRPMALTLVAGSLMTSLLTLYAVATTWSRAFWRAPPPGIRQTGTVLESEEQKDGEDPASRAHGTEGITGRAIVTSVNMPPAMLGSTMALVALALSYTVMAGPLSALAERIATELLAREPYISAVLGGAR